MGGQPVVDGRRQWLYGKTRSAAAEKLTTALKQRQDGLPIPGERLTVAQILDWWLKKIEPSLRARSHVRYEQLVRVHIKPRIGQIPVARPTVDNVEHLYAAAMTAGLSSRSTVQLHSVLRKALKDGERAGLVARNVCTLAVRSRIPHREMKTLTRSEARTARCRGLRRPPGGPLRARSYDRPSHGRGAGSKMAECRPRRR